MQDLLYIHKDYSNQYEQLQKVSISLRPNGFSFVIQAVDSDRILAVCYSQVSANSSISVYSKSLSVFFKHEMLQKTFQTISIVYVTPRITIIPSSLFSTHNLTLLFETNHVLVPNDVVLDYKLKQTQGYLVYTIPSQIIEACKEAFGNHIRFLPQAAPFLESSCIQNKIKTNKQVYILLDDTFFDIAVLEGHNILLYNTFEFSNNNDYMYFVMNVFEQLQLNPLEIPVMLSGVISKASHYYESIQMFIKHVHIIEPTQSHKDFLQYPFEQSLYPFFNNECNVSLCE